MRKGEPAPRVLAARSRAEAANAARAHPAFTARLARRLREAKRPEVAPGV
jgi:hypothetical protein